MNGVLIIDQGLDVNTTTAYIEAVFRDVFGVDPATDAVGYLENVSLLNRRIGFDSSR